VRRQYEGESAAGVCILCRSEHFRDDIRIHPGPSGGNGKDGVPDRLPFAVGADAHQEGLVCGVVVVDKERLARPVLGQDAFRHGFEILGDIASETVARSCGVEDDNVFLHRFVLETVAHFSPLAPAQDCKQQGKYERFHLLHIVQI